jgi:hypothetical protein
VVPLGKQCTDAPCEGGGQAILYIFSLADGAVALGGFGV